MQSGKINSDSKGHTMSAMLLDEPSAGQADNPHELRRRLKVSQVVLLAMADASPAMAVLLLTAGVF